MLVLARKVDERIVIGDDIEICVVAIRGKRVRLGIAARRDVPVRRAESAGGKPEPSRKPARGTSVLACASCEQPQPVG